MAAPADPSTPPTVDPDGGAAGIGLVVVLAGAALAAIATLRRRGVLARDAFSESARDPAALPPIIWTLAAIGLFIAAPLGALFAGRLAGLDPGAPATMRAMAITSIGGMAAGAALIVAIVVGRAAETKRAGLRMSPWDVFAGVGALLLLFPIVWTVNFLSRLVAIGLARVTGGDPPGALAHSTLRELAEAPMDLWWWGTVAAVTIGAPLVEETLYRGFLQSAFAGALRRRWLAIFLTSAFFAIAHIGAADYHVLAGLFTLSVGLGVVFERTGRLGVAIAAHSAFNILNILLAMSV